jgi:hypothetical protein
MFNIAIRTDTVWAIRPTFGLEAGEHLLERDVG